MISSEYIFQILKFVPILIDIIKHVLRKVHQEARKKNGNEKTHNFEKN